MRYYFHIFDLFPFFLFFLMVFAIAKTKGENRRLFLLLLVVLVFLGIRYGVGYDYFEYKNMIINIGEKTVEPLAQALMVLSNKIHYQLFFIVSSLLTIYPVYYVCKKYSVDSTMSFLVYLLIPVLFLDGMSTVRNAVAYPMVLWSFMILLKEKRKVLFVLPLIIAIGFHFSSIIALLILPVAIMTFKKSVAILLWVISFFLTGEQLLIEELFQIVNLPFLERITWYLQQDNGQSTGRLLWIAVNCFNVLNFYYWNQLAKVSDDNRKYMMVYNIGCIIYNLTINLNPTISLRLSNYCSIFLILILPYYKYVLPWKIQKNAKYIVSFLILYFSAFFINVIIGTPPSEKISYLPYQTIFHYVDYINLQ